MGLPIFVVPTEPDVAIKAAEKVASVPRSSIRRQRTVRRSQAPVSVENIRRRMQGMVADSSTDRYDVWENPTREQRPTVRRPDDMSSASLARGTRALEDERLRLRDNISFERQHPPNVVIDGPLMPPAPEPRDYTSAEVRRQEIQRLLEVRRDIRRIARRRPAPSPPYTDTDLALMARMGTESPRTSSGTPARSPGLTLGDLENTATLSGRPSTEIFNSARDLMLTRSTRQYGIQDAETPANQDIPATEGPGAQGERSEADMQSRADISERFRVLNRVSNHIERSHRFLRQQRLDGLGDRDRSLSPDGGPAAWDTLLTSITPDPQPPSAGSSFASASAAAAASTTSANPGPTSTTTTMSSFGIPDENPTLQDCDLDSGLNSDEEGDMQMLHHIVRTGSGRQLWGSSWNTGTRADRVAQASSTEDTEHLGGMQRIISRLAERDDIPEEWWRMAGLRREPAS